MNEMYLDKIVLADCREHIPELSDNSLELLLSDIPYGISLDRWDVIHSNTNSALLGQSPAQVGKSAFKRRGKPINGWSQADRNIGREYEEWCRSWVKLVLPKLRNGASVFIFGARRTIHHVVNVFEDSGMLLKDMLAWKKTAAHHRAQRVSIVFERRGLTDAAQDWQGWRLGNLAPAYEPIAWLTKPESTEGQRKRGEGATGEISWAPLGQMGGSAGGLQALLGAPMAACSGCDEGDGEIGHGKRRSRTGLARVCGDVRLAGWRASCRRVVRLGVEWLAAVPGRH